MGSTTRTLTILVAGAVMVTAAACSHGNPTTASPSTPGSATASASGPTNSPRPHTSHKPSSPGSPAATEFNPPGDIPDNQVFVDFGLQGVHIRVPEGWARRTSHGTTTFTDHYNSVALEIVAARRAPTVASARASEVPPLFSTVAKPQLQRVISTTRSGQRVVEIDYLVDSAPSPVTGKVVRDAAQRFEFFRGGHEAVVTLTGPQNADNVDPWHLVSNSVRWR